MNLRNRRKEKERKESPEKREIIARSLFILLFPPQYNSAKKFRVLLEKGLVFFAKKLLTAQFEMPTHKKNWGYTRIDRVFFPRFPFLESVCD